MGEESPFRGGVTLVFCRSRDLTGSLCQWLTDQGLSNVSFYHSKVDADEKEKRRKAWASDEIKTMVATGAFGTGLDKKNVRVVVHFEEPYSALDLVQESGRAGRDGLKSWHSILLAHDGKPSGGEDMDEEDHPNDHVEDGTILREMLTTTVSCRRLLIERYLDGNAFDCYMTSSHLCDICGGGKNKGWEPVMMEEHVPQQAQNVPTTSTRVPMEVEDVEPM